MQPAPEEGELGLDVELGHGLVLFGEIEERVVAEAVAAAWGDDDLTFKSAVTHGEDFAVAGGGEDAVITGAALGEGNSDEEGEEIEVVALVYREGLAREGLGSEGLGRVEVVGVGDAGAEDVGGPSEG